VPVVRSGEPEGDSTFAGSQQHAEPVRPVQQALAARLALVGEQADASAATDSIPTIATRATQGRRR
jgi:hypothetical protein